MKKIISILIFNAFNFACLSQSVSSMGWSGIKSINSSEYHIFSNAASLHHLSHSFFILSYQNHYFLNELDDKKFGFNKSFNRHSISISISNKGDERLRMNDLTLGYSQSFDDQISLGIAIKYTRFSLSDIYGNKSVFHGSIGGVFRIDESNIFSFLIDDPTRNYIDERLKQRMPIEFSMGHKHQFSSQIFWINEISKRTAMDVEFKTVFAYQPINDNTYSLSYNFLRKSVGCNLSWKVKSIRFDLSFSYDMKLGLESGFGMVYILSKT